MKGWEEEHIRENLSDLIHKTTCSVELFAKLQEPFSPYDIQAVKAEKTPIDRANKLYEIAMDKTGCYESLAVALKETKQSEALAIFLDGYRKNGECIPSILQSQSCKNKSRDPKFLLQTKIYTWEQLVSPNGSEQLYENVRKKLKLDCADDEPITLIRDVVSPKEKPEYYIPRTFFYPTKLNEDIFVADCTKEHIFVVKGANISELVRATGLKKIETFVPHMQQITERFIMITSEADFEKVCKLRDNRPVHMIEFREKGFFWVKSTDSLEVIQQFLRNYKIGNKLIDEEEAIKRITSPHAPSALSITGSAGMGKTSILSSLAIKIKETCQNAVVLYVLLRNFVDEMYLPGRILTFDSILSYVSTSYKTKSILQEMIKNSSFQFYFLLDGYDDILPDELQFVDTFLQSLIPIKSIRFIVTTRPHLKKQLENILETVSLEILPFDESTEIEFLTKYWINKHGATNTGTLQDFAKKCIESLKVRVQNREEENFAGIPLHCKILAEVYCEDAQQNSELEKLPKGAVAIFQMYKFIVEKMFSKIRDPMTLKKYYDAYVYHSIKELFPNWFHKFERHLIPLEGIDEKTLYSIGLLENVFNSPSFVHQTLAEYVLADFVSKNLKPPGSATFFDFFFKEIFGGKGVYKGGWADRPTLYHFNHPIIAYFLNSNLPESILNEDYSSLDIKNIKEEDICIAANVCCSNNLERCFDLTTIIMKRFSVKDNEERKNKYIKNLLHLVLENKNNSAQFIEKVRKFLKQEFGLNLSDLVFPKDYLINHSLQLPNCTPLHLALCWRRYDIVKLWLKECGKDIRSIKALLHFIVIGSATGTESVIAETLSIIQILIHQDNEWLEEELKGRKPLLAENVHPKILKLLVKLGANINTYSSKFGTVLHTAGDKNSISDVVWWAFKNGFNLVNQTNERGLTPLMVVIWKCSKIVDDEILRLFSEAGGDFNAQDREGDSVLFYAIKYSSSLHLIHKLLEYGANPNHQNKRGRNAAHIVLDGPCGFTRFRLDQALGKLQILKQNGFDGLNQIDNNGWTPLMLAVENSFFWVKDDLQQLLDEKDFDFNAQDNDGNSVLFYAMKPYANLDFIEELLNCGTDPNHRNCKNENAAHWIILQFNRCQNNLYLALEILKLLQRKGFNGFDQEDSNGDTPLKLAMNRNIDDREFLDFLRERTSE